MGEMIAAIDAAILIEAGKYMIGHLALPSLRRVWTSRFAGVEGPDELTARGRVGIFLADMDAQANAISADQRLAPDRLGELFALPEVTASVASAFDTAIETDDPFKSSTLADLVITRLYAADGGTEAIATRVAIEQMRNVTPRQTRVLALIALLQTDPLIGSYDPTTPLTNDQLTRLQALYCNWLERHFTPLISVPAAYSDFTHLNGLGLIDTPRDGDRGMHNAGFTPSVLNATIRLFNIAGLNPSPSLRHLVDRIADTGNPLARRDTGIPMIADCSLSPAGFAIANSALFASSGLNINHEQIVLPD